jgi:hypothetical protein
LRRIAPNVAPIIAPNCVEHLLVEPRHLRLRRHLVDDVEEGGGALRVDKLRDVEAAALQRVLERAHRRRVRVGERANDRPGQRAAQRQGVLELGDDVLVGAVVERELGRRAVDVLRQRVHRHHGDGRRAVELQVAHPAVARHRRRRRRRAARRRRRREQRLQVVVLELAPQVVEDVAVVLGLAADDRRADPDLVLVLQRVGVVLADARPVDVRAVRRQVLEHDVDAVLAALEPDAAVHRRDDVVRERLAAARLAAHRPLALGQIVRAVLRLLLVADAGEAGPGF